MLNTIPVDQDVRLWGFVSYVGTSSMEISITVEPVPEGANQALENAEKLQENDHWPPNFLESEKSNAILTAKFTMVIISKLTLKGGERSKHW
jgi:acyl-coenzyme A thioesterase 9